MTGGAWGVMIRRPLEAGTRTLYVMWLLFLPLLIFAPKLYFWADSGARGRQDRPGQASLSECAVPLDPLGDLRRGLAGADDAAQQMVAARRRDEIDGSIRARSKS